MRGVSNVAVTTEEGSAGRASTSLVRERALAIVAGAAASTVACLLHGLRATAISQGVMVALAGLSFVEMRKLRELGSADYRKHGIAAAWWHLATMNLIAFAYGWFMYDGYMGGADPEASFKAFGSAAKDWMLASGLVGATLGLFRSTGTNSAALQALRQNQELLAEVGSLRRTLGDATDLTTMALDASQARSLDDLVGLVEQMVTTASDLPEKSELVDAFTIWIRDDVKKAWRILSGRGISAKTITSFEQPVLETVTEGKGIVANLAAMSSVSAGTSRQLVISSNAAAHPWHLNDPYTVRKTEGLAAVLVLGKDGMACGALCLTSEDARGIPSKDEVEELRRFEKVLQLWAGTFTLPVQRWFELIESTASSESANPLKVQSE